MTTDKPLYVSAEGLQKLKDELTYLTRTKKPEVADRIDRAKELGDLKENAEYHDAKDEMAFVSGRIMELEDSIHRAVIIEKSNDGVVGVGNEVKLKYVAAGKDKEKTVTITGAAESDPLQGLISNESPLGRTLLGMKVGETREVEIPAGKVPYTVLEIS